MNDKDSKLMSEAYVSIYEQRYNKFETGQKSKPFSQVRVGDKFVGFYTDTRRSDRPDEIDDIGTVIDKGSVEDMINSYNGSESYYGHERLLEEFPRADAVLVDIDGGGKVERGVYLYVREDDMRWQDGLGGELKNDILAGTVYYDRRR